MEEKCGTFGYLAPEINGVSIHFLNYILQNGILVTPAIDMWAFGLCLY